MARYTGPKCKLCRREGQKLFLKGTRCETKKCSLTKREKPPGMHTWRRGKPSAYSIQLREKQKVKRLYGILEAQFRIYYTKAGQSTGNTGANLLELMERRLDNVLFKTGFALSRNQARQYIVHGHVTVNGRKVDRPSFLVKAEDQIGSKDKDKTKNMFKDNYEIARGRNVPSWLEVEETSQTARVTALPRRDEIEDPINEQLIIEFCSK